MQRTLNALNEAIAFKKTLTDQREIVWIEEVLTEVRRSQSESIRASGAIIRSDFVACPVIWFSRIHLESILQNLLSNAIKYAKENHPPVVNFKTFLEDDYVILECKDQGIGIDLDMHKDRLFRIFQRFHPEKDGMGLGLYLVRSIVESFGGKMTVESAVDKGSIFKIYLANANVQENLAC